MSVCFNSFFFSFLQRGITSPRAYVHYDSLQEPDPKYFEQILTNSLPEGQIQQFCADFLALFRDKEHKRPVPCAIGASDSGKTSLFSPVFQIVPLSRIARVTKQKSFNKSMIDSSTEVIFLDEAYNNLLDIDDWKIICQGGFTSHDVKWKKAQGFHCRASMYITCQQEMDFGEAHNDAMNRRLHKYFFRSLPQVNPEANQWLREHAMDCIVWAQKMVATNSTTAQTGRTLGEREDGLESEDIQRILSVSLLDDHAPECNTEGGEISLTDEEESEAESDSSDENEDNNHIDKLRHELEKAVPGGFRHRQLSMLLRNAQTQHKAIQDRQIAGRRRYLVNLGVTSKSQADRLITHPDEPLPTDLARREQQALNDRAERLEKQRERDEQEKVKKAFSNPWLLEIEKEMAENNMRLERGTDPDMSATLTSLLEIDCEKLRAFHEKQGTLRLQMAVEKRKEICVNRGLVDPRYASSVKDVYSPLPVIVEGSNQNMSRPTASNDDGNTPKTPSYDPPKDTHQTMFTPRSSQEAVESESEDMFITPKTPCYEPSFDESICKGSSPLLRRVPSPDNRPSKRARLSRSQTTKGQSWVTGFFSSQKRVKK